MQAWHMLTGTGDSFGCVVAMMSVKRKRTLYLAIIRSGREMGCTLPLRRQARLEEEIELVNI
jgi:hypothetical protein